MYLSMLKNHINSCHGNNACFHSANKFFFEDEKSLHFWGPMKNCPGGVRLVKLAPGVQFSGILIRACVALSSFLISKSVSV